MNSITESLSCDYKSSKATSEAYKNHHTKEVEWWNPLALAAKANASVNLSWHEAMSGPEMAGYWEAIKAEILTLIKL